MNTRYGAHEVTDLLGRAAPVGVVVPHRFLDLDPVGMLAGAVRSGALAPPWVAVVGAPADEDPAADLAAFDVGAGAFRVPDPTVGGAAPLPAAGRPDDLCTYFTTSGSTGAPKLPDTLRPRSSSPPGQLARALDMPAGDALHPARPRCGRVRVQRRDGGSSRRAPRASSSRCSTPAAARARCAQAGSRT